VLCYFVRIKDKNPFVECATFADAIGNTGFSDLATWHYVDTPFFDEGFEGPAPELDMETVEWAIDIVR